MISNSLINFENDNKNKNDLNVVEINIESNRIPNIDDDCLEFLKRIVSNDLRQLEFEDNLCIYSLSGYEIGNFKISVKPVIFRHENCFNVRAKSIGRIDDAPCGTEINAYVNHKLETLDQDYYEFIQLPHGHQLDRRICISLQNDDEYIIEKNDKTQKESKKTTFKIKRSLMNGYMSESANILLQRLMIQYNKIEPINLFTFDSELNPCQVLYRGLDDRLTSIENQDIKVKGIERTIESISDLPTTWQIYFSLDGHMINRVQIGYPAVMKATKLPKKIEIDEYLPRIEIKKKELNWQNDIQLKSNYLDRKEELKNEYDQYLNNHPELKSLISDFMQSVLSLKPNDVLSYSAKYFAPFSTRTKSNKFLHSLNQPVYIPKQQ